MYVVWMKRAGDAAKRKHFIEFVEAGMPGMPKQNVSSDDSEQLRAAEPHRGSEL